ncbi:MAG: hypothetical protein ACF8AM_10745 [Rhodopirellula sp. JB055]|uniref:hypothetical protein n=1 Tax=Rhodopirellula sp. JB055 TaxID=3342846 RepID=UPI00370CAAA4
MARKPNRKKLPANHVFERMGWIHELEVMEAFGYSWATWERCYRTEIPGRTTPTGRWYRESTLDKWFADNESGRQGCNRDHAITGQAHAGRVC